MPPSLLPPLPTFPGADQAQPREATMATSVPANYYNSKPIDPALSDPSLAFVLLGTIIMQ